MAAEKKLVKDIMTKGAKLVTCGPKEKVADAMALMVAKKVSGLPVVDEEGNYAGLFGEREFMTAVFPGYVGTLMSARMIRRSLDETIERRMSAQEEIVRGYLTTDPVLVEDDYADTQLAETFLHHRVMVVPIATEGHVHAVVTRSEFFQALYDRVADIAEDFGD